MNLIQGSCEAGWQASILGGSPIGSTDPYTSWLTPGQCWQQLRMFLSQFVGTKIRGTYS